MCWYGTLLPVLATVERTAVGQDEEQALDETIQLIEERFPEATTREELYRAAIDGIARYLDDVAQVEGNQVLNADEYAHVEAWLRGERDGIGVEFVIAPGMGLALTEVYDESPAQTAGLMAGDLVVAVGDHPFTGLGASAIHGLVRKATASPHVVLDVRKRDGGLRRIEVDRGPFRVHRITIAEGGERPVVRVQFFGEGAAEQLESVLGTLSGKNAVVLDLRDNEGGLLDEASAAAALFLDAGAVVVHRAHADGYRDSVMTSNPPIWPGKVAILVNRGTCGVAEAFVAALQDHGRAAVIGTRTAGVATYESYYPVGAGLVIKLSDIGLLSPKGRSWASAGLVPGILVEPVQIPMFLAPPSAPAVSTPPDLQREAAYELMRAP